MSDVLIFAFGCIVTLLVLTAVFMLTWAAAKEPSGEEARKDAVSNRLQQSLVANNKTLASGESEPPPEHVTA